VPKARNKKFLEEPVQRRAGAVCLYPLVFVHVCLSNHSQDPNRIGTFSRTRGFLIRAFAVRLGCWLQAPGAESFCGPIHQQHCNGLKKSF
jgi:hypothetical protein